MGTRAIGEQLVELDSASSTNKAAAERLQRSELRHGAVILAHEQTDGRGQRDRSWQSAPGLDLTFSIVLLPELLKAGDQFVLARISALAVHDVLRELLPSDVRVKWPNDVLVGQRKVAGILIKNEVVGGFITSSIVGIGLNVNNPDLDPALNATSLKLVTGREQDRMHLLDRICEAFEKRWRRWEEGVDDSTGDYLNALWARDRFVAFTLDGASIKARPLDVDAAGRLIIEHEDGSVKAYALDRLRFGPRD